MKLKLFYFLTLLATISVSAQSYDLLGVSTYDGTNSNGFLYRYDNGNIIHIYDFLSNDAKGKYPNCNLVSVNGVLYGTTISGGTNNAGVLFTFNPISCEITPVYNFDRSICSFPRANLVIFNSKIYGYAHRGNTGNDEGVLYEFDPVNNIMNILFTFTDASTQGRNLYGLVQDNGILYGFNGKGGANDDGVLFSFNLNTNIFTTLHSFLRITGGTSNFYTIPIFYNNTIYGINIYGGSNDSGTIYKYDLSNNQFQVLYNFENTSINKPKGNIVLFNGNIYGAATRGGLDNFGGIFKYNISNNQFSSIYEYQSDTYAPLSGLSFINNLLIGVHGFGSNIQDGGLSIYNLTNSTLSTVSLHLNNPFFVFTSIVDNNISLIETYGGDNLSGKISSLDIGFQLTSGSYSFSVSPNGNEPWGKISIAPNGKYYGIAKKGGANGKGLVFEIDNAGNFQDIYDFTNLRNYAPFKKITLVGDDIYLIDFLNIIKINTNTHTISNVGLLSNYSTTPMILASDGNLYGASYSSVNMFNLNPNTGQLSEFTSSGLRYSTGDFTEFNGKLYGFAYYDNLTHKNCIFSYDLNTHSVDIVTDIDDTVFGRLRTRSYGHYKLTVLNSKLYGTTNTGTGSFSNGTLFELDPITNSISKILDLQVSNHYGQELLAVGGNYLLGTFEDRIVLFDVQNHTQQDIITLSPEIYSSFSSLINLNPSSVDEKLLKSINVYPNPTTDFIYISPDENILIKSVTLFNMRGEIIIDKTTSKRIDLTKYTKGVYLLKVKTSKGQNITKLVVKL